MMKKLISAILASGMLLAFAACMKDDPNPDSGSGGTKPPVGTGDSENLDDLPVLDYDGASVRILYPEEM